jgi:hypothetical protein
MPKSLQMERKKLQVDTNSLPVATALPAEPKLSEGW